jgi:O-antigen/teichoic acid export membrane protein
MVLTVANAAIVARWLGPDGKGAYTLATLMPFMLALFLSGGIGLANVYFAGSQRIDIARLTANTLAYALMATAAAALIVAVLVLSGALARWMPGVPMQVMLLASFWLPLSLLNSLLLNILQGLRRIREVNFANLAQGFVILAATGVLVIVLGWGLVGAVIATWLGAAAALAMAVRYLKREGASFRPRWDASVLRPTISYGLRGHIGSIFQFLNYRLDTFIVNGFLGTSGVGFYGSAVSLGELLWQFPTAVGFVIFPKSSASRPEEMNRFTPRVLKITLGILIVGAVMLALTGPFLIEILYGPAFAPSYLPLLALLPGIVFMGGGKVLANEMAGRGYLQYNSICAGLSLVLTIILDLTLIPRFGAVGAAAASSLAYLAFFIAALGFYVHVSRQTLAPAAVSLTERD